MAITTTPRIVPVDLLAIVETQLKDLRPFLLSAHFVVEQTLLPADQVDDEVKREIERWLAAHFLSAPEPEGRLTRVKVGDIEEHYAIPSFEATGLTSSEYGRNAIHLDPTGKLGQIGKVRTLFEVL